MASRLPTSRTSAPHKNPIRIIDGPSARILCVADIRGQISNLNTLARKHDAQVVIHTGDFGFYGKSTVLPNPVVNYSHFSANVENASLSRMNDRYVANAWVLDYGTLLTELAAIRTLKHLITYSPLITSEDRERLLHKDNPVTKLRDQIQDSQSPVLSEFSLLLSGRLKLSVPVYTVWGACEDVFILEKFRLGEYDVHNLHVIDEATSHLLDIGGVKLRLLGLGGALVPHKLFDNGEGQATISGGQGTMWITALQIGELVDTAQRVFDVSETRLLVSHVSPGREGLIAQLALVLKADLTISGGLHFRYASSYNDFSVHADVEGYKSKLMSGKELFGRVWDNVRSQVESVIDEEQRVLLEKAVLVTERVPLSSPPASNEEQAWKNCWNWNLCDAAYGHLILDFTEGRVSAELRSQGFNYAYRRTSPIPPTHDANPAAFEGTSASGNNAALSSSQLTAPPAPLTPQPLKPGLSSANSTTHPTPGGSNNGKADHIVDSNDLNSTPSAPVPSSVTKISTPKNEVRSLTHTPTSAHGVISPKEKSGNDSDMGVDRSSGRRTPGVAAKRPRNPWTLFVSKLPIPSTELDIRELFGSAQEGITVVKLPLNYTTRMQKPIAFVEFKDEQSMHAGLANHAEKIRDNAVRVSIAENREDSATASDGADGSNSGPGRGRGSFRSRGGRSNGLFANALGQAQGTMGRGSGPARKLSASGEHQQTPVES